VPIRHRAGRCAVWWAGCVSGSAEPAVARPSHPRRPASPEAFLKEGQKAARSGRPAAPADLSRAGSRSADRRPARPPSAGLTGRSPHPPGCQFQLWLGRTQQVPLSCLALAESAGQAVLLRTLSLQRRRISTTKERCGLGLALANGEHTVDTLRRLQAKWSNDNLIVVWDDSARMSPIITVIPLPRISAGEWPLSRPASIRTPAPSPTASGSKITSTLTKKNYASQFRIRLATAINHCLHCN
jgi:hypothetical protein